MDQRVAMRGELGATSLANLLATVERNERGAEVRLYTELGVGHVWFSGGALVDAELGGATGEAALGRLMGAEEGRFEVIHGGAERPRRIQASVQAVLRRQASRSAEWSRLLDAAPSLQAKLRRTDARGAGTRLVPERRRLIELCDGERTVTDILDASGRDAVEALGELIALIESGYVRVAAAASEAPVTQVSLSKTIVGHFPGAPRLPTFEPEVGTRRANPVPAAPAEPGADGRRYSDRPGTVEVVELRAPAPPRTPSPRREPSSRPGPGLQVAVVPRSDGDESGPAATRRDGSWVDTHGTHAREERRAEGELREPGSRSAGPVATGRIPDVTAGREAPASPNQAAEPAARAGAEAAEEPGGPEQEQPALLSPDAPASDERFVGRYHVLCRLGRGGMGAVYLCRVTGEAGFRRLFALKVLRHRIRPEAAAERSFLREAYIASRLHHPNAIAVVDAAIHARQPYLVLEYVEGCSLATLLQRSPDARPPGLVAAIVGDALDGLAAAHALTDDSGRPLQLVHGDVSPQNVLVGVDGVARVSDFGVSRLGHAGLIGDGSDPVFGHPGYVAPERLLAPFAEQSADVFSMGVVLWNALTGHELFLAETPERTLENVLAAHIAPPSTIGLRPPPCFDELCLAALDRDPRRRPASAQEMAEELRRIAARNQLVLARSELSRWVREHFQRELEQRRLAILDASRGDFVRPVHEPTLPRAVSIPPPPVEVDPAADAGAMARTRPARGAAAGAAKPGEAPPPGAEGTPPDTERHSDPATSPRGRTALRNGVVLAASVLALGTIGASILRPEMLAVWFDIDLSGRGVPPLPASELSVALPLANPPGGLVLPSSSQPIRPAASAPLAATSASPRPAPAGAPPAVAVPGPQE